MSIRPYNPSISIAAKLMQQGDTIAYPTEAVWGLGCDPHNQLAVNNILRLKQRDPAKGLILVAASIAQVTPYLSEITDKEYQQLEQSWPGPITWLVPANKLVPPWIKGQFSSVAIRVSNHSGVVQLCKAFGGVIVSTSANPQGKPAPKYAWQVYRYFGNNPYLGAIVKGRVGHYAKPSTIKDLSSGRVIR